MSHTRPDRSPKVCPACLSKGYIINSRQWVDCVYRRYKCECDTCNFHWTTREYREDARKNTNVIEVVELIDEITTNLKEIKSWLQKIRTSM